MQPGIQLYQKTYLTVLSFLLGIALVVSLLLNLYQLYLSGAVYFVTVGTGQRLVRPGELPEATIRNFAKDFVRLIGNGTPAGLEQNWHDAGAYLSQKALADFSDARARQLDWVHRGNISLTTEALEVVRVETLSNRLAHKRLTITATQTIRFRDIVRPPEQVTFQVVVMAASRESVHGLWVLDVKWPKLVAHADEKRG